MTPYQKWTEQLLNDHIKDKTLTEKVTRYTRATKHGKTIVCPECNSVRTVYHFNYSGLTCPECKESVGKYDWEVL